MNCLCRLMQSQNVLWEHGGADRAAASHRPVHLWRGWTDKHLRLTTPTVSAADSQRHGAHETCTLRTETTNTGRPEAAVFSPPSQKKWQISTLIGGGSSCGELLELHVWGLSVHTHSLSLFHSRMTHFICFILWDLQKCWTLIVVQWAAT